MLDLFQIVKSNVRNYKSLSQKPLKMSKCTYFPLFYNYYGIPIVNLVPKTIRMLSLFYQKETSSTLMLFTLWTHLFYQFLNFKYLFSYVRNVYVRNEALFQYYR